MKGQELQVVSFVNERNRLKKRTTARRARCKRFRIETAVNRLVQIGFAIGATMVLLSCIILENPDPSTPIPWGMLIGGVIMVTINGILKYSLEEN